MDANLNEIRQLLKSVRSDLAGKANVVATGIGYKVTNNKKTGDLAIICSVSIKKKNSALPVKDIIPASFDSIPVDVHPSGPFFAYQDPKLRYRPAPCGVSIGHYLITAGTLGCLVKREGKKYILSNNHVLANSNAASVGDDILQPGPYDGGSRPSDVIARLYDFVPITFNNDNGDEDSNCSVAKAVTTTLNRLAATVGSETRLKAVRQSGVQAADNLVDAALAEPVNVADVVDEIMQLGHIDGITEAELGMSLQKFGRTTELTTGNVLQIDVTASVSYGSSGTANFVDQIMAGGMSAGGDSGSAVLSGDNKLVGLLFAGSSNSTIINRIQNVFDLLNVTL